MQIKNNLILLVFFLSFSIALAQKGGSGTRPNKSSTKISIDWGTEYKNVKNEAIWEIIYDDGQYIYANVVTTKNQVTGFDKTKVTPSLVKFDNKMTPVKRNDFTTDKKDILYDGTYYMNGKFFMVTSTFNSKTNTRELYAQKYNTDLVTDGTNSLLWKIVGKKGEDVNFKFDFSPDSGRFMVSLFPEQKKTENRSFAFKIFDKDLNPVYDKSIQLKKPSNQAIINNVQVNNKNEVFALFKIYNDDKIKEEEKGPSGQKIPGYKYVLTKYSKDNAEKEFDIDLGNKYLHGYRMNTDPNGDLHLFISYEEYYGDGINGFIYLSLDATTGTVKSTLDYPLTAALVEKIDKIQDDKPKNKKPAIHEYFTITDLKTVEDGSTYAIIEKDYSASDKYGMTYYSLGMIVLKIDISGTVKWCDYIPKMQFFNGYSGYLYHRTMYFNNKLFIFYNDEEDNEHYDIEHAVKAPKKFNDIKDVYLMMVEFDDNGKMTRSTLGNTDKLGTNVDLDLSKQLSPKRMVLCGLTFNHFGGNKQTKLGVANFE